MLKKTLMMLTVAGWLIHVSASEEAPKGWWWTRRKAAAQQKKQIKQQEAEKKMLFNKMQAAWKKVSEVLEQQIKALSDVLGDIGPNEVENRLASLDQQKEGAFKLVGEAIASYSTLYTPGKLLHDYPFLQEDDTVVQKARVYAAQADIILSKFDEYLVARLKNMKTKKQQPRRPEKSLSISLEVSISNDAIKIAEMLGKSAARIAKQLEIDVPSNKSKDELTALLLTCNDLIEAERGELQKMIDAFESKWRGLLTKYAPKDTEEAHHYLTNFITVAKPDLINKFKDNIVEHWKDPRMHKHPHVQDVVGEEFKN